MDKDYISVKVLDLRQNDISSVNNTVLISYPNLKIIDLRQNPDICGRIQIIGVVVDCPTMPTYSVVSYSTSSLCSTRSISIPDRTTNNTSPRPSTSTKIAPKPSTTIQNTLRSDSSSQSNTPPRPCTQPNQHTPRPSSSEPYTTSIPITTTYHMPLSSTSQHVTPPLISPSYHIQIYSTLTLVNHYSTTSILPVPSSTSIPFEKPTLSH